MLYGKEPAHGQAQQKRQHPRGRAVQEQQQGKPRQGDQRHAAGQAVDAVEHVDGVDHQNHAEQREHAGEYPQPDDAEPEQVTQVIHLQIAVEDDQQHGRELGQQPPQRPEVVHIVDDADDGQQREPPQQAAVGHLQRADQRERDGETQRDTQPPDHGRGVGVAAAFTRMIDQAHVVRKASANRDDQR